MTDQKLGAKNKAGSHRSDIWIFEIVGVLKTFESLKTGQMFRDNELKACIRFLKSCVSGGWVMRKWKLTTSVRRHSVLAGARGSRAAWRSHTLILLRTQIF